MAWTAFDFIVFGLMLLGLGVGIVVALKMSKRSTYRLAALLVLGGGFLMVWANLAVGIIGNEENPRNLIFYVVLIVGLIGALATRFAPRGLCLTLRAMAAIQLLIGVGTAVLGWALLPVFTVFYVALWLVAAQLFAKSIPIEGKVTVTERT